MGQQHEELVGLTGELTLPLVLILVGTFLDPAISATFDVVGGTLRIAFGIRVAVCLDVHQDSVV